MTNPSRKLLLILASVAWLAGSAGAASVATAQEPTPEQQAALARLEEWQIKMLIREELRYQQEMIDGMGMNAVAAGLLNAMPPSSPRPPGPAVPGGMAGTGPPPPGPTVLEDPPGMAEFVQELQNEIAQMPPPPPVAPPFVINNVTGYASDPATGQIVVLTSGGSITEYQAGPGGITINWANGIESPPEVFGGKPPPPGPPTQGQTSTSAATQGQSGTSGPSTGG